MRRCLRAHALRSSRSSGSSTACSSSTSDVSGRLLRAGLLPGAGLSLLLPHAEAVAGRAPTGVGKRPYVGGRTRTPARLKGIRTATVRGGVFARGETNAEPAAPRVKAGRNVGQ